MWKCWSLDGEVPVPGCVISGLEMLPDESSGTFLEKKADCIDKTEACQKLLNFFESLFKLGPLQALYIQWCFALPWQGWVNLF